MSAVNFNAGGMEGGVYMWIRRCGTEGRVRVKGNGVVNGAVLKWVQ